MTMASRRRFGLAGPILALLVSGPASALEAQDRAGRPDYLVGEAVAVEADARRLTVKIDTGDSILVLVDEQAVLLRAQPGATSLAGATPILLAQIAAGDRVMVRTAESSQPLRARQVVVMTRDDVVRKREAEQTEWRRRGVLGVVTAVDAAKGQLTLRTGRAPEAPTITLSTTERPAAFRRYAHDSVRFGDARPSSFAELQVGDELRALGERDPESGVFVAEQVVFGSFRMMSGAITSVDPALGVLVVRDDESHLDVTVAVGAEARVRRLTAELAGRLARRRGDGAAGGREAGPRSGTAGSRPEELLERLPPNTLAELEPGERILVSSTKGPDPARANAIAVLAGIEALLPEPSRRAGRPLEAGLPPELLDLGLSIP
jgi:hypothetical protein